MCARSFLIFLTAAFFGAIFTDLAKSSSTNAHVPKATILCLSSSSFSSSFQSFWANGGGGGGQQHWRNEHKLFWKREMHASSTSSSKVVSSIPLLLQVLRLQVPPSPPPPLTTQRCLCIGGGGGEEGEGWRGRICGPSVRAIVARFWAACGESGPTHAKKIHSFSPPQSRSPLKLGQHRLCGEVPEKRTPLFRHRFFSPLAPTPDRFVIHPPFCVGERSVGYRFSLFAERYSVERISSDRKCIACERWVRQQRWTVIAARRRWGGSWGRPAAWTT